jgi:hypothetical protein
MKTRALLRLLACAVAQCALFSAAPTPAPSPDLPGWTAGDHVYALAGTWSCRTVEGVIVHATGSRTGDTLTVHNEVMRGTKTSPFDDRYVFDPPLARWHVQTGLGGFAGGAAPWTGESWAVEGENGDRVAVRLTLELLPGGDFRRTFAYDNQGRWFPYSVERCTPGTTPPPADACIAKNYPATTLEVGPSDAFIPPNLPSGTVYVVVSLDANSRIVGARVQSGSNPQLNAYALSQTRRSRFRTAIVDCKPIAADYVFSVTFP